MRFLICGSRYWTDYNMIARVLVAIKEKFGSENTTIIHGGQRGADSLASMISESLGFTVLPFVADWEQYDAAAGPIRNQKMLEEGKPDAVIAFVLSSSKGTWDMIRRAKKEGLPLVIFDKEGKKQFYKWEGL